MPNEALISRIETLLDEVVSLGGASERTGIVSGLIVADSAPSGTALANYIIVRDNRDGNFISVLKTPGQTYANNDLVSVLFIEGTEPIALAQSPGSSSSNVKVSEVWESDFGAVAGSADTAGDWTWQGDVTLASGNLNFSQASTIAVTGALQINATGGIVINENGADVDFRIEGDTEPNLFFVDAGNNRIGIGTATPATLLHLVSTASPEIRLEDTTGSYFRLFDSDASRAVIAKVASTGTALIDFAPQPSDGTSIAQFRFFRTTNTSGQVRMDIFQGDGTATLSGVIFGNVGDSYISLQSGSNFAVGASSASGKMHVDQSSTTGAKPVLYLDQADLSEEFIEFASTVGAGNPIDTAAIGTYYGKIRVAVAGVGFKFMPLHNS